MKFCSQCNSRMIPVEKDGKLYQVCKICGHEEENTETVLESTVYQGSLFVDTVSKKYMIHDKSLPRTTKVTCPNEACPSRNNKLLQESIFFNEKDNMKLIYICVVCNTEWKYS